MKAFRMNRNGQAASSKIVDDYKKLALVTNGLRSIGRVIVATIGSWDMLHIGHLRYLMKAKTFGDVLVVGVDSDRGIKSYKGKFRPVVPQNERCEMLTYQSPVDFVTLVDDIDAKGRWGYGLIKVIRPDIFIAVRDSYPPKQLAEIRKYCRKVIVLPRQAENTSTSNLVQNVLKGHLLGLVNLVQEKGV